MFKDSREEEKPIAPPSTVTLKVEAAQYHEPVLKIYTMKEQREREQAKAAKAATTEQEEHRQSHLPQAAERK